MPIYEYACNACGHRFELIQKYSDPPAHHCPDCGGPVTKLVSSPAIQFKGEGWYITDYARKGSADAARSEAKASEESSASKTETKKTESGASTSSDASKPSSDTEKK